VRHDRGAQRVDEDRAKRRRRAHHLSSPSRQNKAQQNREHHKRQTGQQENPIRSAGTDQVAADEELESGTPVIIALTA
jgi:hypothetical protein